MVTETINESKKNRLAADNENNLVEQLFVKQNEISLLRVMTCGSVDDGKSTLIGRLLWETKQVLDDQVVALQQESERYGTQGEALDFALLVDGLTAEREQGITIDVAYRFFSTTTRKFILADTPGHEQYTRNMATAASTAVVAIILIDATKGILPQTRRHAYIASLMGVKAVILAVNKMDLVEYSEAKFNALVNEFNLMIKIFNFYSVTAIPISAVHGINITEPSSKTKWYIGSSLLTYLENLLIPVPQTNGFIFPVQWVNRPDSYFRGISGTVAEGIVQVGDEIQVTASGQTARIKQIVTMDGDLQAAAKQQAITLVLTRELDVSRGDIITAAKQPVELAAQFEVTILWMGNETGHTHQNYILKLAAQETTASISAINYRININNGSQEIADSLYMNAIAVCHLSVQKSIAFTNFTHCKSLGAFILIDRYTYATVAAGIIHQSLHRAKNVYRQAFSILRPDRERLKGHKGKVIWFTGLSGSGKSTIANALEVKLHQKNYHTYILDGDNIRLGLNKDLGFTDIDRKENIRRIMEVAKLMADAGLIVITAFISPFEQDRQMARTTIGKENFLEVYVNTPLEVCETRDPKGLYKKARAMLLPNMSGLTSSYEIPKNPDIVLDGTLSTEKLTQQLYEVLGVSDFV